MKKGLLLTAMAATFSLAGCTSTGTPTNTNKTASTATNVGLNVFKVAMDNKCRSELEKKTTWRLARIAMSPQQEEKNQTKICGCVSEQAPNHVTLVDMANAAIDPDYRSQLVTKVVIKSLQTCYGNFTKKD